jgi:pyruvate dehydrogenase E2 component (dihydrolipoamide acetyltransferase)
MLLTLTLPRLGETMEEGRIVGWIKKSGDAFRRGETLVEIETDKTVVELPALVDGVLEEIFAVEGAQIKVGDPLCRYVSEALQADSQERNRPGAAKLEPASAQPQHAISLATASSTEPHRCRATPKARRIARHRGVDLAALQGTGRRLRIEARDVEAYIPRATHRLDTSAERELSQGPSL